MNEKIEVPTMKVPPLKKICMTIGQLPASYVETMSYYEMLVWFVNYLRDDIIPVVNANGEATKELQELFVELQSYVNNYFDNLDVQDEINNKLDEMAESGQLTDIIAQYLGLAGMITFNNVTEMKAATNLVNGSKCATLGYHSVNDGGNAFYKIRNITNDDIVDEMFIIALHDDNLIAELIHDEKINVLQIGFKNDNSTDCSVTINNLIENIGDNENLHLYFPAGKYKCNNTLVINKCVTFEGVTTYTGSVIENSSNVYVEGMSILSFENANIENADCINANDYHRKTFKNLIILSNSYGLTMDRTKTPAGSQPDTPVFVETITKTAQNGLHVHGYGSIVDSCQIIGFSGAGLITEQHNKLYNNEIDRCKEALKVNKADNLIDNTRINMCGNGLHISAGLNTITNTRCDSLYGEGIIIDNYCVSNIIDNTVIDYSWLNGLHLKQSANNNIKCRSCCKYAGYNYDDVPSDNRNESGAILIESYSTNNYISTNFNIQSAMDTNDQTRLVPSCQVVANTITAGNIIDVQYSSINPSNKIVTTTDFEKMFRATAGANAIATIINGNYYYVGSLAVSTDNYKVSTIMNNITYPFTRTANSRTPALIGLINVDNNGDVWISKGTSSSSDWIQLN